MSNDLISRKVLAEEAKNMSSSLLDEWDTLGVLELIYRQPSVDPHKHGRWERCFEDWRRQIEGAP